MLKSDLEEIASRLGSHVHELAGKTVVLTGGRGFLGRYFVDLFEILNTKILEKPLRLVVLDNLITSGDYVSTLSKSKHIEFIVHDVIQPFNFNDPVHYVIHAAGIASPFYYRAYPLETLEVAILGTKNMLSLAQQKGARFTFFSSSEIYGDPDPQHIPTRESFCNCTGRKIG